jgi:hypothetical protein
MEDNPEIPDMLGLPDLQDVYAFDQAAKQELVHMMAREIYTNAFSLAFSKSLLISPPWVKRHAFQVAEYFYQDDDEPRPRTPRRDPDAL